MSTKIWTYSEALEIFPRVKDLTEFYYEASNELKLKLEENILPENIQEDYEETINEYVAEWYHSITELNIEVKGLWLIDFDNGNGYYCWRLGEESLLYEHSYEDGFSGRKLIQRKNDGAHQ